MTSCFKIKKYYIFDLSGRNFWFSFFLGIFNLGFSRGFSLGLGFLFFALLTTLFNFSSNDSVSFLNKLFHWSIRLFLLETFNDFGWVTDWWFIWFGVEHGVFITWLGVRLGFHHITLAFVEHASGFSLVFLVTRHNFFKLFILVMNIFNLHWVWWDQEPLVHIHNIDVKGAIFLLKTLGVGGSLIAGGKSTTDLDTKLIILLWGFWSNNGKACVKLSWDGSVILFKRHVMYYILQKTLSQLKK